jgi:hypothetical protein
VTLPFPATIDAVAVGRWFRLYCIERRQVTELGARRRHDIVEEFDEMVCDAIESRADEGEVAGRGGHLGRCGGVYVRFDESWWKRRPGDCNWPRLV